MNGKVGIIIVNYNMPERTDALCTHITDQVKWPHILVVVDNGSDVAPAAKSTTVRLPMNVQTTGGWLEGLRHLKRKHGGEGIFAYWFLITSAKIPENQGDILEPMARFLLEDSVSVGIHPALTKESTTDWGHLYDRGTGEPRRTWMIDNIASLYRARWFDSIGWFDESMKYAWGIDLETCWKARKQHRSLWIDERVSIEKITNIGYTMNRMNMSADDRKRLARTNMAIELGRKYGPNWWARMTQENVQDGWR